MAKLDMDATNLLHLWKDMPVSYVVSWLVNQSCELYFNASRRRVMLRSMDDRRKELLKKRLGGFQGLY